MSDQPPIIRQDAQHTVTVTEGALVATSKPSDPHAPVVRQTLAGQEGAAPAAPQDPSLPLPAPALTAEPAPRGPVFERTVPREREEMAQAPEALRPLSPAHGSLPGAAAESAQPFEVPAALTPAPADAQTPVEQFLREKRLAGPVDEAPAAHEARSGPVFERSLQDRFEAAPPSPGDEPPAAPGPVIERSSQDSFETLPGLGAGAHAQGPVFERSLQDRFETQEAPAARAASPAEEAPVLERAYADRYATVAPAAQPVQLAPREGGRRPAAPPVAPAPAPVPTEQARQLIAETAHDVQQKIEESIGAADQEWVEMDFPARVIKLKIENDRVRTQLDQLEEMAQSHERASASA